MRSESRRRDDACARFDAEILPRLTAGEPPGPHVDECADCRAALARHQALVHGIRGLDADAQPRPDWQAQTFARIAAARPQRARAWWAWSVAVAALLLVVALVWLRRPRPIELALRYEIHHRAVIRATDQAAPGDFCVLHVSTGDAPTELRVYRDGRDLVFRCGPGAPCAREPRGIRAELVLPSAGHYRVIAVLNPPAQAIASTDLNRDVEALRTVGARIEAIGPAIIVR
jgi:hypothetical protein